MKYIFLYIFIYNNNFIFSKMRVVKINEKNLSKGMTKLEANIVLKAINDINNDSLNYVYTLMTERGIDHINLTPKKAGEYYLFDSPPHIIGEMVFKKNYGILTRFYDADGATSFLCKPDNLQIRYFSLTIKDIKERIMNWCDRGIHFSDFKTSNSHPERVFSKSFKTKNIESKL